MLNFCLYKPGAMSLSLLHFQPCAGSEPDCNCCLSNKYTYMQLRRPAVTRVNFHLTPPLSSRLQKHCVAYDFYDPSYCVCFPFTDPELRLNTGVFLSTNTEQRARGS